ncbi:MAG TPA: SCO family protein [Phycisphaerae bacterium]|jgi:protein SCO1/2
MKTVRCAGILVLVCGAAGRADDRQLQLMRDVRIDQQLDAQVPLDLEFRDESGATVKLSDCVNHKPVILTLNYYRCPMLCTLILNGLLNALRTLAFDVGNQFNVVTVSIDPREEPPLAHAKRQQYLRQYGRAGAETGWHFLTGSEDSIRRLADAVGFRYAYDAKSGQFAHASGIMVLTPAGRVSRYFYGIEYAPRDLRLALVEASNYRIGSRVDQLLLLCYHYDPATGKYGLAIIRLLQFGGAATVAGLGLLIVLLLRRERRARTAHPHRPAAEGAGFLR